jgi:adenine deaminase
VNPVEHYGLNVGRLRVGDPADFVELSDLNEFQLLRTFIGGRLVAEGGQPLWGHISPPPINRFETIPRQVDDFPVPGEAGPIRVIEAIDGELITRHRVESARVENGTLVADPSRDLLKIAVVNRYRNARPAVGFIKGFGLKQGAIASSVAHDSHNVVAVGASDEWLCAAVNRVIEAGGGLAAVSSQADELLPLPIAGLMSNEAYDKVAAAYSRIDRIAKELGSPLRAPYLTLSFMALLVIPELKISDLGLIDCTHGSLTSLFV